MQGDVSFTFLDRIEEVELNIVDRRWQSALALALTLPDICGERCWQLRCEYLHQNKGFLNDENNIHFHLGLNCGMSVCQLDSMNIQENRIDIRIDIEQFCLRMCKAAKSYYDQVNLEKDFSLYNTPVLDFIQVTQKKNDASIIALICGNERYAKGLKEALQFISEQIMLFYTPESAKTKLGKHKPDLWIVTEDMTRQPNQPWRADRTTPVIIITGNPDAVEIKIQIDQLQAQHDRLQKERDQLQERMNHLEEQREHLQMQTDQAFRSADEIEKIYDEIWNHANTIHLYSSLAEEESKSITMKEKQKEIIRTTEEILNIIYKYKGNV